MKKSPSDLTRLRFFYLLLIAWLGIVSSGADAATATLSASTPTPEAGVPFSLSLTVDSSQVRAPESIDAPGLAIQFRGRSQQVQMINGTFSASVVLTYQALASKEGPVTIPAVDVEVDGKALKTAPLKLNVVKARPGPKLQPGMPPGLTPDADTPSPTIDESTAFLKVTPERSTIYVGESVEVTIKAYVDTSFPIRSFAREVLLQGENFVFQPAIGPDVTVQQQGINQYYVVKQENLNGKVYNVLTFKTSLTAVKPGEYTIDPVDYNVQVQTPKAPRRPRGRSLLDDFFGDDSLFDQLSGRSAQELRLKSEPLEISVIPLPKDGRPDDFTGAIGRFSLTVDADKKALQVDDSLTLTAKVIGHGNFERIGEVSVEEGPAWKRYPGKNEFKGADELNLSGEKVFEETFIAAGPTTEAPLIRFSYFDPTEKKYLTLEGKRPPIVVTGTAKPSIALPAPNLSADQAKPETSRDLPLLSYGRAVSTNQLAPAFESPAFLAINGVAALGLVGLLTWRYRQTERPLSNKERARRQRREEAALLSELKGNRDDPSAFATTAMLLTQRRGWPSTNVLKGDSHETALRSLSAWAEEARWSSNPPNPETFYQNRDEWLQALEALLKAAA